MNWSGYRPLSCFFSQLGWALYGVSLVVCAFEFGIEYTTGRANLQHTALGAIKGFLAVSLFTILPVRLYALSVSLQGQLSAGLTGYGTSIGDVGQQIITDLGSVESIADMTQVTLDFGFGVITSPIMLLFCIILMAYAVIKVFFANLKRAASCSSRSRWAPCTCSPSPGAIRTASPSGASRSLACVSAPSSRPPFWWRGLWFQRQSPPGAWPHAGRRRGAPHRRGLRLDTTTRANIMSAVYTAQAAVNTTRTIVQAVK